LAGGSLQKGTSAILRIWKPHFPHLTVIKQSSEWIVSQRNLKFMTTFVPESELRQLQNRCGIHLCPSETEGFGHYLMEAMSTKAVVVTTDAPPMNEFIQDRRCLVPFFKSAPQRLGINYYVDTDELKNKIESLMALPEEELRKIGEYNRMIYLQKRLEFQKRLNLLLLEMVASKRKR
jgi:glycosyltransferase involved in cell wall biosynthesis